MEIFTWHSISPENYFTKWFLEVTWTTCSFFKYCNVCICEVTLCDHLRVNIRCLSLACFPHFPNSESVLARETDCLLASDRAAPCTGARVFTSEIQAPLLTNCMYVGDLSSLGFSIYKIQ